MGVYNRDYMRNTGRPSLWSGGKVTWWLIGINTGLWLIYAGAYNNAAVVPYQAPSTVGGLAGFITNVLTLHPRDVFGSLRVWQPFTTFWLHDPLSMKHLFYNMLMLYFFGRQAEASLGRRGYLRLYLGGGLTCSVVFMVWAFLLDTQAYALGASGAVYAVMVWIAFQNPRKMVYLMFVLRVPIWLVVGLLMVGMDGLSFFRSGFTDGAAIGHLAGAAWGWFTWVRLPRFPTLTNTNTNTNSGPGAWIVDMKRKRERAQQGDAGQNEAADRARVEELLQKISDHGIGALTEAEKQFLQEASRRYR